MADGKVSHANHSNPKKWYSHIKQAARLTRSSFTLPVNNWPIVFRGSHGNVLLDVMQLRDILTFAWSEYSLYYASF